MVRFLHLALYVDASRRGQCIVVGDLRLCGDGRDRNGAADRRVVPSRAPRAVLWAVAVAIDYAGPAWLTRERLRGLQRVAVAHFAERYGLFVIICLGESIVAIGVGRPRAARSPNWSRR